MYSDLPTDRREKHPYHMYDEIKAQPGAVARSLQLVAREGAPAVAEIGRARRVYVTGCGTSYHAARAGAWMVRSFTRGRVDARAVEAYEFSTYLPGLRSDDLLIAISHSGGTYMTGNALQRARQSGMATVAVTGFPESQLATSARYVLPTGYPEERSWAHTASYTAALATLAAVANDLAEPEERLDLSPLPNLLADVLTLEEMAHRLAASTITVERFREPVRILVAGAGPNVATASEGVLKLLETSYALAEYAELEEVLHGPLAAVTSDTLCILLVPPGPSTDRARDVVAALQALSVTPVVLCGEENQGSFEGAHRLVIPDLPEAISPIPYVVPLQFLSYFLTVGKGINPDLLHRDEAPYREARAQYR